MEQIGLMPSESGKPGGAKTGESMMDYILLDGSFLDACRRLKQQCDQLPWIDRYPVFRRDSPLLTFTRTGEAFALDNALHALRVMQPADTQQQTDASFINPPDLIGANSDYANMSTNALEQDTYSILTSKRLHKSGRVKYQCKSCAIQLWGKPGMQVGCLDCKLQLSEVT